MIYYGKCCSKSTNVNTIIRKISSHAPPRIQYGLHKLPYFSEHFYCCYEKKGSIFGTYQLLNDVRECTAYRFSARILLTFRLFLFNVIEDNIDPKKEHLPAEIQPSMEDKQSFQRKQVFQGVES